MCDCEIQVADEDPKPGQSALAQWLEYIESIFAPLSIGECLDILFALGHQNSRFRGADGVIYNLTDFYTIPDCLNDPGDTCQIEFLGGPPKMDDFAMWYHGTMITWVVDGLLYDFAANDGDLATPIIEECEAFINDADKNDEYDVYDDWEAGYLEIEN